MSPPESISNGDSKPSRYRWLGHLTLILAIFAILHWWRSEPLANGNAPSLTGIIVGGEKLDIEDLKGRPVLVHYWATWCPMCRLGDDAIDSIAKDFDVVTIAIQSGRSAEIAEHMRREGLSFPVIPDPYGELATSWGVPGVPASFVLDPSGRIKFASVGYTTEIGLRGRLWAAGSMR